MFTLANAASCGSSIRGVGVGVVGGVSATPAGSAHVPGPVKCMAAQSSTRPAADHGPGSVIKPESEIMGYKARGRDEVGERERETEQCT